MDQLNLPSAISHSRHTTLASRCSPEWTCVCSAISNACSSSRSRAGTVSAPSRSRSRRRPKWLDSIGSTGTRGGTSSSGAGPGCLFCPRTSGPGASDHRISPTCPGVGDLDARPPDAPQAANRWRWTFAEDGYHSDDSAEVQIQAPLLGDVEILLQRQSRAVTCDVPCCVEGGSAGWRGMLGSTRPDWKRRFIFNCFATHPQILVVDTQHGVCMHSDQLSPER